MTNRLDNRNKSILTDFQNGISVKELSIKYSLSISMIRNIIKKVIPNYDNRRFLNDEEIKYVIEQYYHKSSSNLAKELKCSRSLILKTWLNNGLNNKCVSRQYYCNFDYFEIINKSEKAYWLGFLASDGCVFKRNGHQAEIKLAINKNDIEVLGNLNEAINGNYPIKENKNTVVISIVSDKMANDLSKYNIKPNKTWEFIPNNIPEKYYIDFIIGYIDGDGSIVKTKSTKTINSPTNYRISIVGNMQTLFKIKNMLINYSVTCTINKSTPGKYSINNFGELRISKTEDKYTIAKLATNRKYKTLIRKKTRLMEMINLIENNSSNRKQNINAVEKYKSLKYNWNL